MLAARLLSVNYYYHKRLLEEKGGRKKKHPPPVKIPSSLPSPPLSSPSLLCRCWNLEGRKEEGRATHFSSGLPSPLVFPYMCTAGGAKMARSSMVKTKETKFFYSCSGIVQCIQVDSTLIFLAFHSYKPSQPILLRSCMHFPLSLSSCGFVYHPLLPGQQEGREFVHTPPPSSSFLLLFSSPSSPLPLDRGASRPTRNEVVTGRRRRERRRELLPLLPS